MNPLVQMHGGMQLHGIARLGARTDHARQQGDHALGPASCPPDAQICQPDTRGWRGAGRDSASAKGGRPGNAEAPHPSAETPHGQSHCVRRPACQAEADRGTPPAARLGWVQDFKCS